MCGVQGKLCRSVFLNTPFSACFPPPPLSFYLLIPLLSFHCSSSPITLSCIVYANSLNLLPVPPCSPYLSLSEHPSCSSPGYIPSFLSSSFNVPHLYPFHFSWTFCWCHLPLLSEPSACVTFSTSPVYICFSVDPPLGHILISLSYSCVTSSSLYPITGSHPHHFISFLCHLLLHTCLFTYFFFYAHLFLT